MTIYISAPFGNYIKTKNTRSVTGSFTLERRTGLLKQVINTLRYREGAWYNSIGLRNPGVEYGIKHYDRGRGDVLSLAAIKSGDWEALEKIIPDNIDVELNLSCPNIEHFDEYSKGSECFINNKRKVIAKLSPLSTRDSIVDLYKKGFRTFHGCNTLPTQYGGMSGAGLRNYVIQTIVFIKSISPYLEIIAGGGIQSIEDIKHYKNYGATSFSLGTVCFNPVKLYKLLNEVKELNY